MKKTAKLITLAAVLFAGFGPANANAEGMKLGADVVSSYVWRGSELGNSAAVQPTLSYTTKSGVVIGAWGSYALTDDAAGSRYKEIDLSVSMPVGPVTLGVINYNIDPENGRSFDFRKDGVNSIELTAAYTYEKVGLLAGVFVAGNDFDNALYCEATYPVYEKDGYTAKAVFGLGSEDYYGDQYGVAKSSKIAIVNTGITVSKDRYTGSFIYNPDTENSFLVFMASF
jgi:hypothetical protein